MDFNMSEKKHVCGNCIWRRYEEIDEWYVCDNPNSSCFLSIRQEGYYCDKWKGLEDETYILTPWGCLKGVLQDYNIDTENITGRMGEHLVEDFMDLMVKQGYATKKEGEE